MSSRSEPVGGSESYGDTPARFEPHTAMTDFESRVADWLPIGEALERILRAAVPLATEVVPLDESLGRVLATDVVAPTGVPPWTSSAMDGYAVRAEDITGASSHNHVELLVVGAVLAATRFEGQVAAGQAVRIMTGGAVPDGADTVVRVEDTDREDGQPGVIIINDARDSGRHVRPAAEDWNQGDTVVAAGTSIGPGQIAVLASAHAAEVSVHQRPVVAIIASGDELHDIDSGPPPPHRIPESNSRVVAAAVRLAGGVPVRLGIAKDDASDIHAHLEKAKDADFVITLGGASMGEGDLFKRVLDDTSLRLAFWRVKLRPGTPTSFGHLPRKDRPDLAVFGLPGNPASAFVTFEVLVRPFLRAVAGHTRVHRQVISVRAAEDLRSAAGMTGFLRVALTRTDGVAQATLSGPQGSGLVNSLGAADGLAMIPEGVDLIRLGDEVDVILLDSPSGLSAHASDFGQAR